MRSVVLLLFVLSACKAEPASREVVCERPAGAQGIPFTTVPLVLDPNQHGAVTPMLPPGSKGHAQVSRFWGCNPDGGDRNRVRTVGDTDRIRDEASLRALLGCPATVSSGIDFGRNDVVLMKGATPLWGVSWVAEVEDAIVVGTSSATYTGGVNPGPPPSVLLVLPRGTKRIRECNSHHFSDPCPGGLCPP